MTQIAAVPPKVALLCERLGWRGPEGFERLQKTPRQTVEDFLFIADTEAEIASKRAN